MKNIKEKVKSIRSTVGTILLGVLLGYAIANLVMCKVEVEGISMNPTYKTGDELIISRLKIPERGDIIIFRHNKDSYIKRVIALPGDTIMYEDSKIYVNGELLSENYINEPVFEGGNLDEGVKYTLGEEDYFVMGDNRNHSFDSRYFGFVDEDNIIGVKIVEL